jgi:FMN phosphatase YigB (HAD superfamily)
MKIIIDFDDTIFNTYKMMQEFIKSFKKAGFSSEEFKEIYKKSKEKKGEFDQKTVIGLFSKLRSFDKHQVAKELAEILERAEEFVYPDFRKFVDNFPKKELILLSFGSTDYQKIKIENAGMRKYFDKIYITNKDKVYNIEKTYRKYAGDRIVFIDDKAEEIDKVKEKFPGIITLKMERPRGGHTSIKSEKADCVINNFAQVRDVINDITKKQ